MKEVITCPKCGREVEYDRCSTLYLKCRGCGSVLVTTAGDADDQTYAVVDYGIDDDGNMWVQTLDEYGSSLVYHKKL